MKWFGLVVAAAFPFLSGYAQAPATGAAQISPSAAEVVKLAGSGVGDEVVLAYVQNSQSTFNLSADNLLYLRDLGVSQPVITAMLNHDNALRGQAPQSPPPQYAPAPAPEAPAPAPAPAPVQAAPPPVQAVAPAPAYVGSPPAEVSYFYNDLSPYGTWVSLPGVGWCWQPTVVAVNRGWRPYCDSGHWVSTDAGWFWQSDYSWGWAPFHYGRWRLDAGCGWVWVPGRVWGPAWVTWRTAGTTCGWAPLPPGADFVAGIGWRFNGVTVAASFDFGLGFNAFAFVSFGNFCASNLRYHCLPPAQATVIFKQTTIVNNYTVVNNTFVNHGIAVNRIAAASRIPVPRASLREGPAGFGKPAGPGGAVVYRTQLKAPEKPVQMVAQKVDPGHPMIQHNPAATMRYEPKPSVGRSGTTSTFQHSPSASSKVESKSYPGSSSFSTPAGGASGKSTTGANLTHQWEAPAKTGSSSQSFPATKTYQTEQGKQGTRSAYGSKPESATPSYSSGTSTKGQSALTEESYKGSGHPVGSTSQGQATAGQTTRQTQSTHFYSPKGGDQSIPSRSMSQQPKTSSPLAPGSSVDSQSKKKQ